MLRRFKSFVHSFAFQLCLLHCKKYQILLAFWLLLFSILNADLLRMFGAYALFFTPEYLGQVNFLATFFLGTAMGVFIMTWHITTFILHSKRFKFLATTSNPFLKYCINNSVLPVAFLVFFIIRLVKVNHYRELASTSQIIWLLAGFLIGFTLLLIISFAYFFKAARTIQTSIAPIIKNPTEYNQLFKKRKYQQIDTFGLKVTSYFGSHFKLKPVRQVQHYSQNFLDYVFKRHHLAGMVGVGIALILLIVVGLFLDNPYFRLPAGASLLLFFSLAMAFIGALAYFLDSWSLLFFIALLITLNTLLYFDVIDFTSKAYGLNYTNKAQRPAYTKENVALLCDSALIANDKKNILSILQKWKQKQTTAKPKLIVLNVSGGGTRSAAFVANCLQKLDSLSNNAFANQCFLITGASGGMLAATYYHALLEQNKNTGQINMAANVSKDLLNSVFSSMLARDMLTPAQKLKVGNYYYAKDRGYAFEQQLNENTNNVFNQPFAYFTKAESNARIPLTIYNATIENDGRKLLFCTQPLRFMMQSYGNFTANPIDAIDFGSFFAKQNPENLRVTTVLRMNATFPYVLPNVWLPSNPIINVMDAGLRDNYGETTAIRLLQNFSDWINQNTSGVVVVQLSDRPRNFWAPTATHKNLSDVVFKPGTMQQQNWFNIQEYNAAENFQALSRQINNLSRVNLYYQPVNIKNSASLSFHLTQSELQDVLQSFNQPHNQQATQQILQHLGHN
jgi:hypothetical protein